MIAVTSLSHGRIDRQQYCINTWLAKGLRVIAVQCPGETESLRPHFPNVTFKEYTLPTSNIFSKNTPTIDSMAYQAIEEKDAVLLINSDISIKDSDLMFQQHWVVQPKTLSLGVRQDANPGSKKRKQQKWGIDAFLVTPEMAQTIPDIGFRIGLPGWDFWIVYHFHLLGYAIHVTKSRLFHENHPKGWNEADQMAYRCLVQTRYNVTRNMLPYFILDVTNR